MLLANTLRLYFELAIKAAGTIDVAKDSENLSSAI